MIDFKVSHPSGEVPAGSNVYAGTGDLQEVRWEVYIDGQLANHQQINQQIVDISGGRGGIQLHDFQSKQIGFVLKPDWEGDLTLVAHLNQEEVGRWHWRVRKSAGKKATPGITEEQVRRIVREELDEAGERWGLV